MIKRKLVLLVQLVHLLWIIKWILVEK